MRANQVLFVDQGKSRREHAALTALAAGGPK
jgi:hypothetical protein